MIDTIKGLPNPYLPITHKVVEKEFVGREGAVDMLRKMLGESESGRRLSNILIIGEKSIGKSTLLNRYREILEDNNFVLYETELTRDTRQTIDEFEFFKELFGDLFTRFGPPDGSFFDQQQTQIWFELTMGEYHSESSIIDRRLLLPTHYSSKKNGRNEILSYKALESDFGTILEQLTSAESDFRGLAVVVDEFQELGRNSFILESLRKLTEKYPQLVVIGAGVPTFLNDPVFEKFLRVSVPVNLGKFDDREALALITKPLEARAGISRNDALHLFDVQTLLQLLERTSGNPLHVRILCSKLFEDFSRSKEAIFMRLTRSVMDRVMDYYCNSSERSRKIRAAIESCTNEQLKAFRRLYEFEGMNLKSIVMLKNAFASLQATTLAKISEAILDDLEALFNLHLFEIGPAVSISDLRRQDTDQLSQVIYKFVGDPIDKLYTSYFYEDLTAEPLLEHDQKSFDDLLAFKLAGDIASSVRKVKLPVEQLEEGHITRIQTESTEDLSSADVVLDEFDRLQKIKPDKELDADSHRVVREVAKRFELDHIAFLSSLFQPEGYYMLITSVIIRGKRKLLFNYFPLKSGTSEIQEFRRQIIDSKDLIQASLDEYSIRIEWTCLHWLPKAPLYVVFFVDMSEEIKKLFKHVADRDFDKAVERADAIFNLNLKLKEGAVTANVVSYNNYGFCLINVGSLDRAQQVMSQLIDKYLISQLNMAYIYFCRDLLEDSTSLLKRIMRKRLGTDANASYLHLAIRHPDLSHGDKVVHDVLPFDVAGWNLALIAAQTKQDESIVNSYLKRVHAGHRSPNEHKRVMYWIKYYQGKKAEAQKLAEAAVLRCRESDFLFPALKKDVEIFSRDSID
jgi:hypothetical protein